jgi:hypothetical protein
MIIVLVINVYQRLKNSKYEFFQSLVVDSVLLVSRVETNYLNENSSYNRYTS